MRCEMAYDAIVRHLEIIGEIATKLSPESVIMSVWQGDSVLSSASGEEFWA